MNVYRKLCRLPMVKCDPRVHWIYLLGTYRKFLRRNEENFRFAPMVEFVE